MKFATCLVALAIFGVVLFGQAEIEFVRLQK